MKLIGKIFLGCVLLIATIFFGVWAFALILGVAMLFLICWLGGVPIVARDKNGKIIAKYQWFRRIR